MENGTRITIHKRALLFILGFILLSVGGVWFIHKADAKSQPTSCTEAKTEGLYNIPSTSPYYRRSLDRDNDKVACEL